MSGILGIYNLDGRPVEAALLERMTRFMAYRGPDDQQTWLDGPVGLGHAMLRATSESAGERQPCSLMAKFGSPPTPGSMGVAI